VAVTAIGQAGHAHLMCITSDHWCDGFMMGWHRSDHWCDWFVRGCVAVVPFEGLDISESWDICESRETSFECQAALKDCSGKWGAALSPP
jgi:hypothetical protein